MQLLLKPLKNLLIKKGLSGKTGSPFFMVNGEWCKNQNLFFKNQRLFFKIQSLLF